MLLLIFSGVPGMLSEAINSTEPLVKRLCMVRSSAVSGTLKGVWEKGVN